MHKIPIGLCSPCVLLFANKVFIAIELEYTQKHTLAIIIVCPDLHYNEALTCMDLGLLNEHHRNLCKDLFSDILSDKNHSL